MKTKYKKCFRNFFFNFGHSNLFRDSIFEFWISFISALSLVVALAGCGSTPPSHFYKLSASGGGAKNSSNISVAVGPVSIPALVDRPQIVISTGPNQVRLEEFDRWASPLQNDIARVIAENLTVLLTRRG